MGVRGVRGSLVSGKQAKAVVPRKWPQLFHSFIHSFARCLICPFQCCVCLAASVCVCSYVCGLPVRVGSGYGCGLSLSQWTRPGRVALPLNMLVTSTLKHKLRFTVAKRAKSNGQQHPPPQTPLAPRPNCLCPLASARLIFTFL